MMFVRGMNESPPALKSRLTLLPFPRLRHAGNGVLAVARLPSVYLLTLMGGRQVVGTRHRCGWLCEEVAFLPQFE